MKDTIITAFKVLGLSLLTFLFFFSIFWFFKGSYGIAILMLVSSASGLYLIVKSFKKAHWTKAVPPQISPGQYMQVNNQGLQLLENIYMMSVYSEEEQLFNCFQEIEKVYEKFISASKIERYSNDMYNIIKEYNTKYPERILSEDQIILLLFPDEKLLSQYYTSCLFHSNKKELQTKRQPEC